MTLRQQAERVGSREDLAEFVRALGADLADGERQWENDRLDTYLDAVASWTEDMPGFFMNEGRDMDEEPKWRLFAFILLAATMYE